MDGHTYGHRRRRLRLSRHQTSHQNIKSDIKKRLRRCVKLRLDFDLIAFDRATDAIDRRHSTTFIANDRRHCRPNK